MYSKLTKINLLSYFYTKEWYLQLEPITNRIDFTK